jgi:hypothetical protein
MKLKSVEEWYLFTIMHKRVTLHEKTMKVIAQRLRDNGEHYTLTYVGSDTWMIELD